MAAGVCPNQLKNDWTAQAGKKRGCRVGLYSTSHSANSAGGHRLKKGRRNPNPSFEPPRNSLLTGHGQRHEPHDGLLSLRDDDVGTLASFFDEPREVRFRLGTV